MSGPPLPLRIAGTVLILGALLWSLPVADLLAAFAEVPPTLWARAVLGFLAGHAIGALKWHLLLRTTGLAIALRDSLRAYAMGLFANLWLPSLVGGDLVRAGVLVRGHGGVEALAVGGVADRALDALALGALAAAGLRLAPPILEGTALRILAGCGVVALVLATAIVTARLIRASGRSLPKMLERALVALESLLASPGTAGIAFACSLAMQLWFVALNAAIGNAMGIAVGFGVWLLVWPLAKLAALVPLGIGGIGVREAALAALLAPFAVAPAHAVAQSLLWQTVVVAGATLASLAAAASRSRRSLETA